jgi:hypothetical protein
MIPVYTTTTVLMALAQSMNFRWGGEFLYIRTERIVCLVTTMYKHRRKRFPISYPRTALPWNAGITSYSCHLQFLLQLVRLRFLFPQLLGASNRSTLYRLLSTKCLERIVEDPFCRVLDRLVKGVGEEWDGCETELYCVSICPPSS